MGTVIFLGVMGLGLVVSVVVHRQLRNLISLAAAGLFGLNFIGGMAINSISMIEEGYEGVLLTFNKASDTPLKPGLRFHAPWSHVAKVNMMDERFDLDLDCASKDLQAVKFQISVTWRPKAGASPAIWREFGHDARAIAVEPAVPEAVKAGTARYDATSIVTKRPELHAATIANLREDLGKLNIEIVEMSFSKVSFTPEFQHAIDMKQAAFEKANKAVNELTEARTKAKIAVADATGDAKAKIEDGRGEATSIKAAADAEAFSLIMSAKANATQIRQMGLAEAQRISTLGNSLRKNPAAVTLEVLQKWDGSVPSTVLTPGQMILQTK